MIDVTVCKESANENQQVLECKAPVDNSRQHDCNNDDNDDDNDDDDDDDDNDNPADSSAARCIQFIMKQNKNCTNENIIDEIQQQQQDPNVIESSNNNVDDIVFRPVYTHQVFPSEYIPGYVPEGFLTNELPNIDFNDDNNDNNVCNDNMKLGSNNTDCDDDDSTKENTSQQQQHSSFFVQMKTLINNHTVAVQNNNNNSNNKTEQSILLQQLQELNIFIELAPSCKVCTVQINPITVFPSLTTKPTELTISSLIDTSITTSLIESATSQYNYKGNDVIDFNDNNINTVSDSIVAKCDNTTMGNCIDTDETRKRTNTIEDCNTDTEPHKRHKTMPLRADENSVDLHSVDVDDDNDDEEDGKDHDDGDDDIPSSIPLSINEIKLKLSTALPPIVDTITEQDMFLSQPIGTIVHEYSYKKIDFVITVATATECSNYHNSVQKLARWYIETADDVEILPLNNTTPTTTDANNTHNNNNDNQIQNNLEDDDDGYWKVMYLFERIHVQKEDNHMIILSDSTSDSGSTQFHYQFVGYVTLYHIDKKCREPISGMTMRICQALVLPHYQRCGHGRILLHTIFNVVSTPTTTIQSNEIEKRNSDPIVVEINVEDPAPGFTQMRNLVDSERFNTILQAIDNDCNTITVNSINVLAVEFLQKLKKRQVTDPDYFQPLSKEIALHLTTITLTDIDQVYIAYEIYILKDLSTFLESIHQGSVSSNTQQLQPQQQQIVPKSNSNSCLKEDLEKGYRLMIKQRLNKDNQEIIKRKCQTKQEAKDMLQKMFEKVYNGYMAIVNKK